MDTHTVDTDTEQDMLMLTLVSQSEAVSTSLSTSETTSTTEMSSLLLTLRTVLMQLLLWTATPTLMSALTETRREETVLRPAMLDQRSPSEATPEQEPTFTVLDTVVTATEWATDTATLVLIAKLSSTVKERSEMPSRQH